MIETRRLKNVAIFSQTILNFVLSRKIIIIIALDINVITNDIVIIISILCIFAELTELHELTLITSFLFLLILKGHMGKLK